MLARTTQHAVAVKMKTPFFQRLYLNEQCCRIWASYLMPLIVNKLIITVMQCLYFLSRELSPDFIHAYIILGIFTSEISMDALRLYFIFSIQNSIVG